MKGLKRDLLLAKRSCQACVLPASRRVMFTTGSITYEHIKLGFKIHRQKSAGSIGQINGQLARTYDVLEELLGPRYSMSPPSTKKRKANSFHESHAPSKKQRNQSSSAKSQPLTSDSSTIVSDEVPFTLECPALNTTKARKKQAAKDDLFVPEQEDGGFPNLRVNYTISPGKAWTDLKKFSNFSSKLR